MAGLFLIRTDDAGLAEPALEEARRQFALHGFAEGREVTLPGWRLLHYPHILGGPATWHGDGEDSIHIAGTLAYDGQIGPPALAAFLRDAELPALDWRRIGGQFVALVRKAGRTFLFTDFFAGFQLHHDTDRRVFSTSLLATAKALPSIRFDAQGVYEFAFNVVPIGDDTVFEELRTLGPERVLELTPGGVTAHAAPKPLPAAPEAMPIEDRLARHRDRLLAIVASHADAFGDRIHCPLSGGIDSRLLLAALRAVGARPRVYVYGPEGSEDVTIARAIGEADGFFVDWIDKGRAPLAPDAFAEQVATNFHDFDALPTYGNIFDNGGNAAARDARHAEGALAASGGCGEIYRNFFMLPERPASALTIAKTFYARFMASDATDRFDPAAFLDRIAAKIAAPLDPRPAGKLSPALIEQVYPRVRCRALFGREISLEARHSPYLMPFLDHQVIAEALALPARARHAGRFEAALLHAIDPGLARHMSAYGHDFAGPPGMRHRLDEWSTRIRPAWLRAQSYAIQRRLRPMGDEHGGLLSPDYMGRVIDLDFPAMRHFFHLDRVADSGMWRRLAALEYLAAHLGSRLRG
jgi:hypothetical protein